MKRRHVEAIVAELVRWRDEGEVRVAVTDEALEALRAVAEARGGAAAAGAAFAPAPKAAGASGQAAAAGATESAGGGAQEVDAASFLELMAGAAKTAAAKPAAEAGRARRTRIGREPAPEGMLEVEPGFYIPALPPAPQVVLPEGDKATRWAALKAMVESDPVCRVHVRPGKQVVFGVGSVDAPIFFCGEAPGADEERLGEPFVGRAGQLLTKMIEAMGLQRGDVYIGNILNWRPEKANMEVGNRKPLPVEMAYCLPYLRAQVEIVRPQVVVALGATAMEGLLGPDPTRRISRVRGTWFDYDGIPLMPTYHPSYVLQYGSDAVKRQVWEDLLQVMERVGLPISERQRNYFRRTRD